MRQTRSMIRRLVVEARNDELEKSARSNALLRISQFADDVKDLAESCLRRNEQYYLDDPALRIHRAPYLRQLDEIVGLLDAMKTAADRAKTNEGRF